jgi:mannosyltransferase
MTGLARFVHSSQKRISLFRSDAIICVSENTKSDLLQYYPSLYKKKIFVVYNGVDDCFSHINNNISPLTISLPFEKGGFLLFVGDRKSEYKNFFLSVKVSKKLNIPLVLVGGGSLSKKEVDLLNSTIGRTRYKTYLGIDNHFLNFLYNSALCLLYPSRYEGFGIPILEAQRAKCPVVCAEVSSIPEVSGGHAVFFSDFSADSIAESVKLVIDKSVNNIVNKGYENSLRFSWENCFNDTVNVYENL